MKEEIYGHKGTAKIIGILYIIGTIAGALSAQFLKVKNATDYLSQIAENPGSLETGAALTLVMAFALALIPVFAFPVLRKYSETAAVGYIVFRGALETCTYIIGAACCFALSALGAAYAAETDTSSLLGAGESLKAIMDAPLTAFAFGIGALIFYTALCKYRLLPRWISGFGIVAALLHMASGALVLAGLQVSFDAGSLTMNLPLAVQEMVMAGWLIAKGFRLTGAG